MKSNMAKGDVLEDKNTSKWKKQRFPGRKLAVGEGKPFRTKGCPESDLANQWSQQTTGLCLSFLAAATVRGHVV